MSDVSRAPISVDYAEDPEGCAATVTALLDEYDEYVDREHKSCPGCPVWRSGLFVANSMLDWKSVYVDGRLDHWTEADIHEYLLDHFPRKVSAGEQLVRDTPACIRDLLYFLSDRGTLTGDGAEAVAAAADRIAADFARANRDPRNWGLAKATFMGMGVGGGGSSAQPITTAAEPPAAKGGAKKKAIAARRRQRKAARAARKRNRR